MENIREAEYKIVRERTLDVIATEIRTIDNHVCKVALQGAVEIGEKLEEAKEKVGHGNWESWCKENLNYSKSQAERFMKISGEYGDENSAYLSAISKTYTCTDLSISKAFRLLQVPEEEIENFAEKNDLNETTVKELEAKIKKLKEEKALSEKIAIEKENLEQQIEMMEEEYEIKEAEKKHLENEFEEYKENSKSLEPSEEILELHKEEISKKDKEIEKIKNEMNELSEKEKKLEEEKEKAVEHAREEGKKEAEILAEEKIKEEIDNLIKNAEEAEKRAVSAEKKLSLSSSEEIAIFKIKTIELQNIVKEIETAISGMDQELANKMKSAFKQLMETLYKRIEG